MAVQMVRRPWLKEMFMYLDAVKNWCLTEAQAERESQRKIDRNPSRLAAELCNSRLTNLMAETPIKLV